MSNNSEAFTVRGRIRSVKSAVQGISVLLRGQHNAWIHLGATVWVVVAGVAFGVSQVDWAVLVFAITLVWVAEALNTAIEYLCDVVSPDFHPLIKLSKDIAAGSVLLSAIGAVILGAIVFVPYLI